MKNGIRVGGSLAIAAIPLLLCAACDSGSGGTTGTLSVPTAPTPPFTDISGLWNLYAALESASGCGCIGDEFARDAHTVNGWSSFGDVEWEISQNGQAILGSYSGESIRCDFAGSFDGTFFSATVIECETEERSVECANGNPRTLVLEDSNWQGTPSTEGGVDRIHGTWIESWSCFNSRNGEDLGSLTLQSAFELNR
jgi:hypothetical protein